ncbi:MAG: TlpA disulfide reductase family protein [Bacteroidota bacterium]|nr:TlpA disulfide reductase family protein [Bacteroidota bacterium]
MNEIKQLIAFFILFNLQIMQSCSGVDNTKLSKEIKNDTTQNNSISLSSDKNFSINPEDILMDFKTWYSYTYYNIDLAQDFIGLDPDSTELPKPEFLKRLTTGNFIPFKILIRNKVPVYRLYKLKKADSAIQQTIEQLASQELSNDKMEGKEFTNFNLTDLNGNIYNKATTDKKIIVVKCWFIKCVACVKEFPELNKLVDEYKQNSNVLFISLAMDHKNELKSFLTKNVFKFAVVPDKEKYMKDTLGIYSYPTLILISDNGKIVKIVNSVKDLIPFLKRETGKAI